MKKVISLLIVFSVCLCFLCSLNIKATDVKTIDTSKTNISNYRIPDSSFQKIYLNKEEFSQVPKYIVCTIKNKFGDPVASCDPILTSAKF